MKKYFISIFYYLKVVFILIIFSGFWFGTQFNKLFNRDNSKKTWKDENLNFKIQTVNAEVPDKCLVINYLNEDSLVKCAVVEPRAYKSNIEIVTLPLDAVNEYGEMNLQILATRHHTVSFLGLVIKVENINSEFYEHKLVSAKNLRNNEDITDKFIFLNDSYVKLVQGDSIEFGFEFLNTNHNLEPRDYFLKGSGFYVPITEEGIKLSKGWVEKLPSEAMSYLSQIIFKRKSDNNNIFSKPFVSDFINEDTVNLRKGDHIDLNYTNLEPQTKYYLIVDSIYRESLSLFESNLNFGKQFSIYLRNSIELSIGKYIRSFIIVFALALSLKYSIYSMSFLPIIIGGSGSCGSSSGDGGDGGGDGDGGGGGEGTSTPFISIWNGFNFVLENDFLFGKPTSYFENYKLGLSAYKDNNIMPDLYKIKESMVSDNGLLKMRIMEIEPEESYIKRINLLSLNKKNGYENIVDCNYDKVWLVKENYRNEYIKPVKSIIYNS